MIEVHLVVRHLGDIGINHPSFSAVTVIGTYHQGNRQLLLVGTFMSIPRWPFGWVSTFVGIAESERERVLGNAQHRLSYPHGGVSFVDN